MSNSLFRYGRPLLALFIVFILLAAVGIITAQPPVPHAVMPGDDCLGCHQAGVGGAPRVAWDHLGRSNDDCAYCHEVSGALAAEIPHPVFGRDDCLSCHREGVGSTPKLAGTHVDYANEQCRDCHQLSAAAAAPTPIPTVAPTPTPEPAVAHVPLSAEGCVSCHQLIFVDEEHALFTGQPVGDPEAGAALFVQSCATCHGEDGTTPVGTDNRVINSEAYWSTHDDAAILRGISAGSQDQMPAFAQSYGGPLSWEEILDLAAFIRSWGPVALEPGEAPAAPAAAGLTFAADIGPLLSERCGICHGGTAGLTVTDYASLMAGSANGPVIVPGNPDESRIVQVQQSGHYGQLNENELSQLIEWITNGAAE